MGGRLSATSSTGNGSTFRFTAQFELAPKTACKVRLPLGDLHGKRVLLIDGNVTNCLILRETLQASGLESEMCRTLADALARLREEMAGERAYSLVIIDDCLPGIAGFEAVAEISQIAGGLPIVMLTTDAKPEDSTAAGKSGRWALSLNLSSVPNYSAWSAMPWRCGNTLSRTR
jgi:CheY-like chemotaxis protein